MVTSRRRLVVVRVEGDIQEQGCTMSQGGSQQACDHTCHFTFNIDPSRTHILVIYLCWRYTLVETVVLRTKVTS